MTRRRQRELDELRALVDRYGHAVRCVMDDDEGEDRVVAYTVGLSARDHPELMLTGLPSSSAIPVLDGAAVTKVWHEADGGWQLLDGDVTDDSVPVLAHREHLLEADHTLRGVLDIPAGSCVTREAPSAPWVRWPLGSA